jgi:hypothetical protein
MRPPGGGGKLLSLMAKRPGCAARMAASDETYLRLTRIFTRGAPDGRTMRSLRTDPSARPAFDRANGWEGWPQRRRTYYPQQGGIVMSSSIEIRKSVALGILAGTLGLGAAVSAEPPPVIKTFEAPGAGNTPGTQQGTVANDINEFGVIAGLIRDENSARHGFLRYPDGKYTLFDHPDAGTNGATGQGTRVSSLNALGAVAGSVRDSTNFDIPFVRDPEGHFYSIGFPNFGGGDGQGINLWGAMVGEFLKLNENQSVMFHFHGFIRNPNGSLTFFDPPGSQETDIPAPAAINDFGAVTGDYWTCNADLSSCTVHGFVREANGKYVTFDAPGASPDGIDGGGTYPQGINNLGEVSGYYGDANFVYHGFVRSANGRITSFDVPTTCTQTSSPPADCAYNGTFPGGVNVLGRVTGTYYGEDGNPHGFWRDADGSVKKFDVPGAGYFTQPTAINDFGQITGLVYDPNLVVHGLLVYPQ